MVFHSKFVTCPHIFLDDILLIYGCILKSLKPNGLKMQQHPLFCSWTYNLDGAWEEQLHFAQLSVNLKWFKGQSHLKSLSHLWQLCREENREKNQ